MQQPFTARTQLLPVNNKDVLLMERSVVKLTDEASVIDQAIGSGKLCSRLGNEHITSPKLWVKKDEGRSVDDTVREPAGCDTVGAITKPV